MITLEFAPIGDLHELDLAFMDVVREATFTELVTLLEWQSDEPWRRAAVMREMARRCGVELPTTA